VEEGPTLFEKCQKYTTPSNFDLTIVDTNFIPNTTIEYHFTI